ncbi:RCC1 domain-containing protein [Nonomuraea lactucae]|uniref:RCC1 domain-containing protein n=1 Tax=Nonomuraea lactucae TaxID=2249762 RepID=UPI000DE34E43|nr:hypothetical protein [Nonomuraea lactucae]
MRPFRWRPRRVRTAALGALLPLLLTLGVQASPASAAGYTLNRVKSWGGNNVGQLGDTTLTDRHTAVTVAGLNHAGVVAISAGGGHSLALLVNGQVEAWGSNGSGALGDGTLVDHPTAGAVANLSGVVRVAAGSGFSLALLGSGHVRSWGANTEGQLGIGNTGGLRANPVDIPGLSGAVAITAGGGHSLALLADGRVKAWGSNSAGQLGIGSIGGVQDEPVDVVGLGGVRVVAIAAGNGHSLALLADGRVKAWGANFFGQLGNGGTENSGTPVDVVNLVGVRALSGGLGHSLALLGNGRVKSWGDNGSGQLGIGSIGGQSETPVDVPNLSGVRAIDAGGLHSLALVSDNTISTWGSNFAGQLGNGSTESRSGTPATIRTGLGVPRLISGGTIFSLAA